jgi:hypothetical protein
VICGALSLCERAEAGTMGKLIEGSNGNGEDGAQAVRCSVCGASNVPMQYCRHVRWTFDQGDPLDFARFALEMSPYVRARGASVRDIPQMWWDERADWISEQVLLHFDACEGYVFGEIVDMDLLARDIWKDFRPEPSRASMIRY